MPFEIQIHAGAKAVAAKDRLQHPAYFGALLVDGRRVEIVDLDIGVGAYGEGEGLSVLRALAGCEQVNVCDALNGS